MPNYRKEGKILTPLTDEEFEQGMETGYFVKEKHKAFVVLLWYSGVRKEEALRATKKQFRITQNSIVFSVGKRLKHGIETPPLPIPKDAPYVDFLVTAVENTRGENTRVFRFSPTTAYLIVRRVFKYPHLFRLSRITNLLAAGFSIAQVHSWTGLTLQALNFYVGLVDIQTIGASFLKNP